MLAVGGYTRFPLTTPYGRFKLQGQLDGGLLWLGVGFPMSLQITDTFYLTSNPSMRLALGTMIMANMMDHWNDSLVMGTVYLPAGGGFRAGPVQLHANAGLFVFGPVGGGMATLSASYVFQ
jgi:hypothetical protein